MSEVTIGLSLLVHLLWIVPLVFIAIVTANLRIVSATEKSIQKIEWVLLEIEIPKENLKSIKAMEQVIAALHTTYSGGIKLKDRIKKGAVEGWMSLEIVGFSEGVHFYIRTPKDNRKLVEYALLSQYPDAEVSEVEDYVDRIKDKVFADKDVVGGDYVLENDDFLPIRTYEYFEDNQEERYVDPLATITEVMSRLNKNEAMWIQLLIRPTGSKELQNKAKEGVEDILGIKKPKEAGPLKKFAKDVGEVARKLPDAMVDAVEFGGEEEKKSESRPRNPANEDKIKAISNKISKRLFETTLRFVYIDDKDEFTPENTVAVAGAFQQFTDQNLNGLKANKATSVGKPRSAEKRPKKIKNAALKKRALVVNYIRRAMPRPWGHLVGDLDLKTCIMNTEEIATLFHLPTDFIKSSKVQAIQSRRGQAPIDLPTKDRDA